MTPGQKLYELLGVHFGKDHSPWEKLTPEERKEFELIALELGKYYAAAWLGVKQL